MLEFFFKKTIAVLALAGLTFFETIKIAVAALVTGPVAQYGDMQSTFKMAPFWIAINKCH